jgi:hypothetical protein
MPIWEYMFLEEPGLLSGKKENFMIRELNRLGKQGWELVGIPNPCRFILKRPINLI